MSILNIVKYPDPMLKRVSADVDEVNDNLRQFMDDMVDTMYSRDGYGLAAVQVGILKNIFVVDFSENKNRPMYFVNPKISYPLEERYPKKEACLSFPEGGGAEVERYEELDIEYLDYDGNKQFMRATGVLAHVIQHEYDHLMGITYTDHVSPIKKMLIHSKVLKKAKK